MDTAVMKVRCEKCGRIKALQAVCLSEQDADLLAADPGEVVERECKTCHDITDHIVLGDRE